MSAPGNTWRFNGQTTVPDLNLVLGPDGFIWSDPKNVLVGIDPADSSVHIEGRIDPVRHTTFIGRDLYVSGPEQLRRIRNIVSRP